MELIILKGHQVIERLKHSVKGKDQTGIRKAINKASLLDWTAAPAYLFEEYNRLAKIGNQILLT